MRTLILIAVVLFGVLVPVAAQDETERGPVTGFQVVIQLEEAPADDNAMRHVISKLMARLLDLGIDDYRLQVIGADMIQIQVLSPEEGLLVEEFVKDFSQRPIVEFVDMTGLTQEQRDDITGEIILTETVVDVYGADSPGAVSPTTDEPYKTILAEDLFSLMAASPDPTLDNWRLDFQFSETASVFMADYTDQHIGDALALVVDGEVIFAPVIQSRLDGAGVISGTFTREEAQEIARRVRLAIFYVPFTMVASTTFTEYVNP